MRNLIYVSALALVACGYSEEKYAEDFAAKWCEQQVTCGGEACPEETDPVEDPGTDALADCTYDPKAAKACVDAEWGCTPEVAGFSLPEVAADCANVYVCETPADTDAGS